MKLKSAPSIQAVLDVGLCRHRLRLPVPVVGSGYSTSLFTSDPEIIRIGTLFLKFEAIILLLYVVLYSVNSLLQALKKAAWAMWVDIYRQGIGIPQFVGLFTQVFDWGLSGLRIGLAVAVRDGLAMSLRVLQRVAKDKIGRLRVWEQFFPW